MDETEMGIRYTHKRMGTNGTKSYGDIDLGIVCIYTILYKTIKWV